MTPEAPVPEGYVLVTNDRGSWHPPETRYHTYLRRKRRSKLMSWDEIETTARSADYPIQRCLFQLSLPLLNLPSVDPKPASPFAGVPRSEWHHTR